MSLLRDLDRLRRRASDVSSSGQAARGLSSAQSRGDSSRATARNARADCRGRSPIPQTVSRGAADEDFFPAAEQVCFELRHLPELGEVPLHHQVRSGRAHTTRRRCIRAPLCRVL